METHRLVLPADLNHYGFLFGGTLLAWVDEASWIAASLDHPKCLFVTVGMDRVEFRHSVREGTILAITCNRIKQGTTSVTYAVEVRDSRGQPAPIFATNVTFVSVDEQGQKKPLDASAGDRSSRRIKPTCADAVGRQNRKSPRAGSMPPEPPSHP